MLRGRYEDYGKELLSSLLSVEAKEKRKQENDRVQTARTAKVEKEQNISRYTRVSLEEGNNDDLGDNQDV